MLFKLITFVIISLQCVSTKKFFIINKFEIESDEWLNNEVSMKFDNPSPPDHKDYAKMARWLVHNNGRDYRRFTSLNRHKIYFNISDWTAMGTISSSSNIIGFPMVNVIATADSARDAKSTGIVYFYLTMLDFTAQDLSKDNKLTALFSMDQKMICSNQNVDPMEPICARLMISGEALRVDKNSAEFNFATSAMLSRHPSSVNWLDTHNFFLCKVNISSICVLDWYGGPHYVTVDDYFKVVLEDDEFMKLDKF